MSASSSPPVRLHRVEELDWSAEDGPAEAVRRIVAAANHEAGRPVIDEATELTLSRQGLETAILLLAEQAGGPAEERVASQPASPSADSVGFAYLRGLSGPGRPELDLVVHPEARGQGVGSTLARGMLDLVDGIPVTAWSHGNHPAAAALASRLGFRAVRELWMMRRAQRPLPEVATPPGFHLAPFEWGDEDALLAVNAAAFADHPEQGELDRDGLAARMSQPWFDPQGLLIARHGDQVVGFHWTKVHGREDGPEDGDPGPGHGEVYVIGVHPDAQGTGIGRALLVAGLRHLAEVGVPEVVLYVEGANRGAIRLYEEFGFTHAASDTDVMYAGA